MENNETLEKATEQFGNLEFEDTFPGMEESAVTAPSEKKEDAQKEPTKPNEEPIEMPDNAFENKADNSEDELYFNNVYDNFRELGLLPDAEALEEGKVLTNEDLVNILEENRKKAARKMYEEEILSKIADKDAIEYLDYIMKGGKSSDYFNARMSSPAIGIDGDISDERVQDRVIAKYLSEFNGMEQDEISEQIQMLNDSGKKEKYARMYLDKIHQYDEAQKETLKRESELREQQEQENFRRTVETFDKEFKATDNIFGVRCDDNKRKRLMDMMFKPIKLQDGSTNTEFNLRLYAAMYDPKKAIILADMLANDFDVKKYSKNIETEVTRKIRGGLDGKPKVKKNQTSPFD